jgi:hypothetical protein
MPDTPPLPIDAPPVSAPAEAEAGPLLALHPATRKKRAQRLNCIFTVECFVLRESDPQKVEWAVLMHSVLTSIKHWKGAASCVLA